MSTLAIIGLGASGGFAGFLIGSVWPVDGSDDLGIGTGMNMAAGMFFGTVTGFIVGSILFA